MSLEARSIKSNYVLSDSCILNEREIECLSLVALGYTNNQAAKIIIISEGMFKKNLGDVYRKLLTDDRANAVALGFLHKILDASVISAIMKKYNLKGRGFERLG